MHARARIYRSFESGGGSERTARSGEIDQNGFQVDNTHGKRVNYYDIHLPDNILARVVRLPSLFSNGPFVSGSSSSSSALPADTHTHTHKPYILYCSTFSLYPINVGIYGPEKLFYISPVRSGVREPGKSFEV